MPLEAVAGQVARGPELLLQALGLSQQAIQARRNEMLSRDNLIAQYLLGGIGQYSGMKEREQDVAFRESQAEYQKTRDTKGDEFRNRELVMAEAMAEIDVALKGNNLEQAKLILEDLPNRISRSGRAEEAGIKATEAGTRAVVGGERRARLSFPSSQRAAEAGARVAETQADVADRTASNLIVGSDLQLEEQRRAGRVGAATEAAQIDVGKLQPDVLRAQMKAYEASAAADLAKSAAPGAANKFNESFAKFVETVSDRVDRNFSAAVDKIMSITDAAITPEMKAQRIQEIIQDRDMEKALINEFEANGRKVQELINQGWDPYIVWRLFKADTAEGGLGSFDWTMGSSAPISGASGTGDVVSDIEDAILNAAQEQ